jgi:hypothetical protein
VKAKATIQAVALRSGAGTRDRPWCVQKKKKEKKRKRVILRDEGVKFNLKVKFEVQENESDKFQQSHHHPHIQY